MEWGPEIIVDGVKPDWLSDDVKISFKYSNNGIFSILEDWFAPKITWENKYAIRLPADHFAYTAIAKGFTPWNICGHEPKDWDGDETLLRNGKTRNGKVFWDATPHSSCHVIGYHPKPIAQPSPVDTVKVQMSEDEAREMLTYDHDAIIQCMTEWGFIRRQSKAERIAKSTNLPLADVERVLAAVEEEG